MKIQRLEFSAPGGKTVILNPSDVVRYEPCQHSSGKFDLILEDGSSIRIISEESKLRRIFYPPDRFDVIDLTHRESTQEEAQTKQTSQSTKKKKLINKKLLLKFHSQSGPETLGKFPVYIPQDEVSAVDSLGLGRPNDSKIILKSGKSLRVIGSPEELSSLIWPDFEYFTDDTAYPPEGKNESE